MYLSYIEEEAISANVAEFSWDLKYAGAQIVLSTVRNKLIKFLQTVSEALNPKNMFIYIYKSWIISTENYCSYSLREKSS